MLQQAPSVHEVVASAHVIRPPAAVVVGDVLYFIVQFGLERCPRPITTLLVTGGISPGLAETPIDALEE
jgi:hypothetical protein